MKLNKLLEKQLKQFFPGELYGQEQVKLFINAVNDSYNAYEQDIELPDLEKNIITQGEADKQIQDQKQFYEQILNHIPAAIAVFDDRKRYLFINPLGEKDDKLRQWLIGKDSEEYYVHKKCSEHIREERRKVFNDTVASKKPQEWEEKTTDEEGNVAYHMRKMFPVFGSDDKLEMVIAYGIDITERKKVTEQIRMSEARYKGIFDNSLALICTHDLNGVLLDLNKASVDTFEFPKEELLGSSLQHLLPPDKQADFEHSYLTAIREQGKAEGIMVALNKRGKKIYLLYHNYLVTNDTEQPYVIGFSQDITDRIDAERALKKSEEKYRNIIANMNLGLLEVDGDEHIVYANNSFCAMSGYEADELTGRNASEIFWNDERDVMNHEVIRRRKKGDSDAYELRTRNKKGEQKWWLISGAPSYDQRGKFVGSIGIHLDITLQKTLEHELRKAKSDAELSAQAKEVFLANISHEIRTPMNAILGIGKLLGKTHLGTQQKFYLDTIHNAANNLLVIINDLLDFSKIEAGKLALEHIGFDLRATLRNAVQILNHKAEEKGLLLNYDLAYGIAPVLLGDPYRINQVLMNLLSNSLKFTDNGQVLVACSVIAEDQRTQEIEFKVVDTGIGMSSEYLANLFDKFSQEDESVTRKFGGTGLGMSIIKQLIEMMGGKIAVESKKNEGTTIFFSIRFAKGTIDDLPETINNAINTQVLKGKRILLVEDNDMNRLLANTILSQYGALVFEAVNGSIAIDMLKGSAYDLVLMDVQMPVKDGIEATRYIRGNIDSSIPIIALTANAYQKEQERCLKAGMNDFITKPFEESKILQVVSEWLGSAIKQRSPKGLKKEVVQQGNDKLYDLGKIISISRGNDDFINKMTAMFMDTMPHLVAQMLEACNHSDWKKVSALVSRIKPSLQTMNIFTLDDDIAAIEDLKATNQDKERVMQHLAHVKDVVDEVVVQLKEGMR